MSRYKPYSSYKSSGIEWIGNIPEDWKVRRIKTFVKKCINGVWGEEALDDKNDIVCIRVADFDMNIMGVSPKNLTIRNINPSHQKSRILCENDILIEKSGGGEKQPVGRVVNYNLANQAVCSNFIGKIELSNIISRFMVYYFFTLYSGGINQKAVKQTTGIQNLDLEFYLNEKITIPPITEQQRIADFLDRKTGKIDELIGKKERMIDLLKEKRAAIINHAVTRGLNPDVPLKPSSIDWIGDIPECWEVRRLKFLVDLINEIESDEESQTNCVDLENIESYTGKLFNEDIKNCLAMKNFAKGDVLFNKLRPYLAKVYYGSSKGCCGSELLVLRSKYIINPKFLFYRMISKAIIDLVDNSAYGVKMPRSNWDFIGSISIAYPNEFEQQWIADFLDKKTSEIDTLIAKIESAIETLKEYRASIITAAVTGKIDVRGETA